MKYKECYCVTEINGEYITDYELPGGKCRLESSKEEEDSDDDS